LRIALLIEYSGKNFHGSQWQLGVRTVQSDLESALTTYLRREIRIVMSGRTDAGVHALGQVVHCDYPPLPRSTDDECEGGATSGSAEEPKHSALWQFDERALCWALNGILAKDISVVAAQVVPPDFHARFSAVKREYVYRVLNRAQRSALLRDTHHFIQYPLDLAAMRLAARALLGRHDFLAFRSTNSDRSSTECLVTRAELLNLREGQLEFWIAADHFVYNMVRIIVGTLIEIGLGKKSPEGLAIALERGYRDLAGPTAPAWGLTLNSVEYPESYKLFEQSPRWRAAQEIES